MLCKSCAHLFGHFFVPSRRSEAEHIKEAFQAWDTDNSGTIEAAELRRVLKALDPDFADRDVDKLVRSIDKDHNGLVDFGEFCDWIMSGDPLAVGEDGFEEFVAGLMRSAGKANKEWSMNIKEVHLREDGLYFINDLGEAKLEASAVHSTTGLELTTLDPEEFIMKVECTEAGLCMTLNTGRVVNFGGQGQRFGPYLAEEGFHVIGMRTKPLGGDHEKITGVDLCPLANAKSYSAPAAVRFAAQKELLQTLREVLAKAAVNVNGFDLTGVTPLMLAAQFGNLGSMRLLMQCKANPNLGDEDGWTALTFASRCGNTSCVEVLLEKGATMDGDKGNALKQALTFQHNSSARALLRAGFGPAPQGTFSLEDPVDPSTCSLKAPIVTPPSGNYSKRANIDIILQGGAAGVHILYTLDGRDPCLVGQRFWGGTLELNNEYNHLRVVAVKGSQRSITQDFVYRVCHYALPDEIISGEIVMRTFPEVQQIVLEAFASSVEVQRTSIRTTAEPGEASGRCWMRIPISDPTPEHQLVIHQSFTFVKGEAKKKKFFDNFTKDVSKASGSKPDDLKLKAGEKGTISVEFTLGREPAMALAHQLADPNSMLRTKGALKGIWNDAQYQRAECLADRISDQAFHSSLHGSLGRKASVDEVIGIGRDDDGVVAMCCPEEEVKKVSKPFVSAVSNAVKNLGAQCEEVEVSTEHMTVAYSMDVQSGPGPGESNGDGWKDGGSLVSLLNRSDFGFQLESNMSRLGLRDTEPKIKIKASARALSTLTVKLQWGLPQSTKKTATMPVSNYLDVMCMVYEEDKLCQIVDFKSNREGDLDGHARSIARAVWHGGDETTLLGGEQRVHVNLAALPPSVTDIFFVLAAFGADNLSNFTNPTVQICDEISKHLLTEYSIGTSCKVAAAKASVMCKILRTDLRRWIVQGLGVPTDGYVNDYAPICETIATMQVGYEKWERRKQILCLRVMAKLQRMTRGSSSHLATFFWRVFELPAPVFQAIVMWL